MSKLLTIIIPVFNGESTIQRCLHSVALQTYKNLEVLVIDDGSNDHTKEICMNFVNIDDRFHYIYQENNGVSSARNTGLGYAKGYYIEFPDSDDYIDVDYCNSLIKTLEVEKTDMCLSPVQVHKNESILRTVRLEKNIYEIDNVQTYITLRKLNLGACNKVYIKKFINEFFDEQSSLGEDTAFVLNYMKNISKISYVENALYHVYLDNDNSLNQKFRKTKLLELLDVRTKEFAWNINRYGEAADKKYFSNMILSSFIFGVLSMIKNDTYKDIDKVIKTADEEYVKDVIKNYAKIIQLKYIIGYYIIKIRAYKLMKLLIKLRGI